MMKNFDKLHSKSPILALLMTLSKNCRSQLIVFLQFSNIYKLINTYVRYHISIACSKGELRERKIFSFTRKVHSRKCLRSNHQRYCIKELFLKISQYLQENTCAGVPFLIKLQVSEECDFIKKELQRRCFLVNIVKFLRTPILKKSANGYFLKDIRTICHNFFILVSLLLSSESFDNPETYLGFCRTSLMESFWLIN